MAATSTPPGPSPPAPPPPRYRGFTGAALYGLVVFGILLGVGALGGGIIAMMVGNAEPALFLFGRLALAGAVIGLASALCRWFCGAASDRLFSVRLEPGDLGGIGLLAGIIVAGSFSEALPQPKMMGPKLAKGDGITIAGPTLAGKRYDLGEHRGKVVLVDFWATWCPPCVGELPNVRAVYDKYHADGFEIVGISLDNQRRDLEKFLKAHPEPWPQIFFDQEGQRSWNNPLARRYEVRGIPYMVVVGPDGRVAATDVRGEGIEVAVAQALGRDVPQENALWSTGKDLIAWFFRGLFATPAWLLFLCGVGGAVLLAGLEMAVRRAWRRPLPVQSEGVQPISSDRPLIP